MKKHFVQFEEPALEDWIQLLIQLYYSVDGVVLYMYTIANAIYKMK